MFYDIAVNVSYFILRILFRFKVYGKENIPLEGNLVLCSNHGSNFDPVFISISFPRRISWMAKKEVFDSKILGFVVKHLGAFPVDRKEMDISSVKRSLKILKNNEVLGIFPEGTRVKEIDINKAKAGVSLLAVRSKSPVLPVYIDSNYKFFSKAHIYIGEPMNLYEDIEGKPSSDDYKRMSKEILSEIYSLKDKMEVNN